MKKKIKVGTKDYMLEIQDSYIYCDYVGITDDLVQNEEEIAITNIRNVSGITISNLIDLSKSIDNLQKESSYLDLDVGELSDIEDAISDVTWNGEDTAEEARQMIEDMEQMLNQYQTYVDWLCDFIYTNATEEEVKEFEEMMAEKTIKGESII